MQHVQSSATSGAGVVAVWPVQKESILLQTMPVTALAAAQAPVLFARRGSRAEGSCARNYSQGLRSV